MVQFFDRCKPQGHGAEPDISVANDMTETPSSVADKTERLQPPRCHARTNGLLA